MLYNGIVYYAAVQNLATAEIRKYADCNNLTDLSPAW